MLLYTVLNIFILYKETNKMPFDKKDEIKYEDMVSIVNGITVDGKTLTITTIGKDDNGNNITYDIDVSYSSGEGISIKENKVINSGVRSISSGTQNGTINVNINGVNSDVAVKGLGSAAYTDSNSYVQTNGDQTISGTKTFSSPISGSITGNANYANSAGSSINANHATFADQLSTARRITIPSEFLLTAKDDVYIDFIGNKNVSFGCTGCSSSCSGDCTGCTGYCSGCGGCGTGCASCSGSGTGDAGS